MGLSYTINLVFTITTHPPPTGTLFLAFMVLRLEFFIVVDSPMLNYDPKKDKINPKRCQICVQRLEEKKSDVIFPNLIQKGLNCPPCMSTQLSRLSMQCSSEADHRQCRVLGNIPTPAVTSKQLSIVTALTQLMVTSTPTPSHNLIIPYIIIIQS